MYVFHSPVVHCPIPTNFGGGFFDDKKIRVTDSGGGPDDDDIRRTQAAALDMMTQVVAPNRTPPRLMMPQNKFCITPSVSRPKFAITQFPPVAALTPTRLGRPTRSSGHQPRILLEQTK